MGAICDICDKIASRGHQKVERGKAKYLGGNGRKTTGITKRQFKPNLQPVNADVGGQSMRLRVCTKCIRAGLVTKKIVRRPFTLPKEV